MKLNEGKEGIPSWMGAICTVILFLIVLAYTAQKLEIMISKKDFDIVSAIRQSYFSTDDYFQASHGFNVAIAYTNKSLDPSYGKLAFYSSEWGYGEDGNYFYARNEL